MCIFTYSMHGHKIDNLIFSFMLRRPPISTRLTHSFPTLRSSDLLYLTIVPSNYADLSLTKSVSNAAPACGASIDYVLSVTNAGWSAQTATGVTVEIGRAHV